jgi:hypothetical protein
LAKSCEGNVIKFLREITFFISARKGGQQVPSQIYV